MALLMRAYQEARNERTSRFSKRYFQLEEAEVFSGQRSLRLEASKRGILNSVRIFALPDSEPFVVSQKSFAVVDRIADLISDRALRRVKRGDSGGDKISWPGRRSSGVSSGIQAQVNDKLLVVKESSTGSGKIKTLSAGTTGTYYIYRFDGLLLAEYDGLGVCLREFIYVGAKLVAEYHSVDGKYYYYTTDQINSTRIVTDDNGTVVYAAAHDPYGGIQQTWVNTSLAQVWLFSF
jgi:hypothetical protein